MPESAITDPGLRTHSCRRTAAYYAAWLGVPETTIKVHSFELVYYIVSCNCIMARYLSLPFRFWDDGTHKFTNAMWKQQILIGENGKRPDQVMKRI